MTEGHEVCAECGVEPPVSTPKGLAPNRLYGLRSTPISMPGTLHLLDCPTLAWMTPTPEQKAELQRKFDAIRESERQAWINGHNYLIGSAR
jgi:hypothetical protein